MQKAPRPGMSRPRGFRCSGQAALWRNSLIDFDAAAAVAQGWLIGLDFDLAGPVGQALPFAPKVQVAARAFGFGGKTAPDFFAGVVQRVEGQFVFVLGGKALTFGGIVSDYVGHG